MTIAPARLTVTIEALRRHRACGLSARLAELEAHLGRAPADDEPLSLKGVLMELSSTSGLDAVWMLRCAQPATEAIRVAVAVAARAGVRAASVAAIDAVAAYAAVAADAAASAAHYAAAYTDRATADAAYAGYAARAAHYADAAARAAADTDADADTDVRADLADLLAP